MRCGIYPSKIIPSSQQPEQDDIDFIRPKLEPGVFFIAAFCFFVKTWRYWNLGWHTAGFPFQRGGKRGLNPNIQILFCPNTAPVNSQCWGFFLFWCFYAFKILKFWRWGIQNIFNVLKMRDRAQITVIHTGSRVVSAYSSGLLGHTHEGNSLQLGKVAQEQGDARGTGGPPAGLRPSLTTQLSPWPEGCSKVTSSLSYVQTNS